MTALPFDFEVTLFFPSERKRKVGGGGLEGLEGALTKHKIREFFEDFTQVEVGSIQKHFVGLHVTPFTRFLFVGWFSRKYQTCSQTTTIMSRWCQSIQFYVETSNSVVVKRCVDACEDNTKI